MAQNAWLTRGTAALYADRWYTAWNSQDRRQILDLYHRRVVLESPNVRRLLGRADGKIVGRDDLAEYLTVALTAGDAPSFEPLGLYVGADSLTLHYAAHAALACEVVRLVDDRAVHVLCHYTSRTRASSVSLAQPGTDA